MPKSTRVGNIKKQTIMETLFFAALGWCGTKYPGWWKKPYPPRPEPEPWRPQPEPWIYVLLSAIGIVSGIISGLAFSNAIANQSIFAGQELIASGLLSFAVSNIITGIASTLIQGKEVRQ